MLLLIHRGLDTSQVACIQLGSLVRISFQCLETKKFYYAGFVVRFLAAFKQRSSTLDNSYSELSIAAQPLTDGKKLFKHEGEHTRTSPVS